MFEKGSVDLVCESPIIASLYSPAGIYVGCFDLTGTCLTPEEEKKMLDALRAMPTYIGTDSLARGGWDELDEF